MGQYVLDSYYRMRTKLTACFLGAAVLITGGCASAPAEPDPIDFRYNGEQGPEDLPPDAACIWVRDERSRETFYGMKITSEMATNWLSRGIANTLNARTSPTDTIPERGLLISLSKAYVNPIHTTLSGVVVIKVCMGRKKFCLSGSGCAVQLVGRRERDWQSHERRAGRCASADQLPDNDEYLRSPGSLR